MTAAERDELLAELGRFVVGEAPLGVLMERIAEAAKALIEPVDEASITFTRGDSHGWTVASTGELATRLDEVQYAIEHGPCLDAASGGVTLLIRDFGTDDRWPQYKVHALEAGARSSLSTPFPVQEEVLAALNLYSRTADAFTAEHMELADAVASRAGIAVVNAVRYESAAQLAAELQEAMKSRAVIEQAKGIIVAQTRCLPDEAFDILVRASQRENRKLRDLATEIVERHTRKN